MLIFVQGALHALLISPHLDTGLGSITGAISLKRDINKLYLQAGDQGCDRSNYIRHRGVGSLQNRRYSCEGNA